MTLDRYPSREEVELWIKNARANETARKMPRMSKSSAFFAEQENAPGEFAKRYPDEIAADISRRLKAQFAL